MEHSLSGFRKFLEDTDSSEKGKKQDYWDSLEDEEGISFPMLKKSFTVEPWVSSHFALGPNGKETWHKLQPWKIVKGSMSPAGADIRMVNTGTEKTYLQGNRPDKGPKIRKRYFMKRPDLQNFQTGGWQPAIQGGGGGGGPPMG